MALIIIPTTVVVSAIVGIGGFLIYDATTYSKRTSKLTNHLELSETRVGKANLKIALPPPVQEGQESKPSLLIVGGGWASVAVLNQLNLDDYNVTVIAPDNYFTFHPLLPSACVGTVEVRSLAEPLRKIVSHLDANYLQAKAIDIDLQNQLIEVSDISHESSIGQTENFYVKYDKVILAMGSTTATHGVPGLENCFQLKTISDAQKIRRKILENLEQANLPSVDEKERKRLLSFVIAGGGPTGVEVAAELYDLFDEEIVESFPKLLREDLSISIIQSRSHLLNQYSEKISEYCEARFARDGVHTILNARVKAVGPDAVVYTTKGKDSNGKAITEEHTLPSGFTLWSTGIAMNPFTVTVAAHLPNQYHKHALEVDSHLRVLGTKNVYALGDAANIETNLVDHLLEIVDKCDENKDGLIDYKEFEHLMKSVHKKFPTSSIHLEKIRDVFDKYADKDHVLDLDGLALLFINISKSMTTLPATAQVANQQGVYLGKKLSKMAKVNSPDSMEDQEENYPFFSYNHLGSLAYLSNAAVIDFGPDSYLGSITGGILAVYLWRSVYWSQQVSFRTRVMLSVDWCKRGIFGRDLSKF